MWVWGCRTRSWRGRRCPGPSRCCGHRDRAGGILGCWNISREGQLGQRDPHPSPSPVLDHPGNPLSRTRPPQPQGTPRGQCPSAPHPHSVPPCSGVERGRDAKGSNSGVSGLPRRHPGQRLAPGCCRPSARPPVWGKKTGIWEFCAEPPRQNPPRGLSPGWQNSSAAWNPPDHPGKPLWVVLGQAGSGRTPVRGWGSGSRHRSRSWDRGAVAEPQQSVPQCGYPAGAVLAPGRSHQGLRLPGTPRAAWRGEGTVPRDAAPVHGGKFPVFPPSSPCPSNGCRGPSAGLPTFSVACPSLSPPVPSLATFPTPPGTPRATRPHQDAADPSLGSLPARQLRPSPSGSIIPEERREGSGKSLSFSTFSSQAGAGSPSPRALSGSPPCSLAPTGCSEQHPGAAAPQTLPSWASRARGGSR